jgi:hypothetical protein
MIEDNWEPTEEDITWTKDHYEKMQVGDTWGIADAVIMKEEDGLRITKATPSSILPLERIGKVCIELGITLSADGVEVVEDPMQAAQETAQNWVHEESGVPLVNFDLDGAEWRETENGEWRVLVKHEDDEQELAPMDFHLIAGDELFFSWDGMNVLERGEIIEIADSGALMQKLADESVIIMPSIWNGRAVPPHLRGLIFNAKGDEEE